MWKRARCRGTGDTFTAVNSWGAAMNLVNFEGAPRESDQRAQEAVIALARPIFSSVASTSRPRLPLFTAVSQDSQSHSHTSKGGSSPMDNVLTVVAKIRAAKDKGDALAALLSEQAAVVRNAEPGCLVYRVHRSTKDPELFLFYEMYVRDAAFDLHRKAPHLAAYRQRREKEGLTDGAVEVEIFWSFTE